MLATDLAFKHCGSRLPSRSSLASTRLSAQIRTRLPRDLIFLFVDIVDRGEFAARHSSFLDPAVGLLELVQQSFHGAVVVGIISRGERLQG